MKKTVLTLILGFLLIASNVYSAGDLIVEGQLGIGIGTTTDPLRTVNTSQSWNTGSTVYSGFLSATNSGTGSVYGINAKGISTNSSGTKVWAFGGYYEGIQNGTGTVTNLEGIHAMTSGTGTGPVTNNTPLDIMGGLSHGTTTNARGIYIRNFGGTGTVRNVYGIYMDTQTKSTSTYQIYSVGGKSYFGGNIGIGTTNPQSKLAVSGLPVSPPDSSGNKGIVCITNDGNMWVDSYGTLNCNPSN